MPVALQQSSFTGGEISPALYARVDLARYAVSLKTCRNFIVRPYGGVENRPGTQFIEEVKDSASRVRLIKFSFSASQNYVLELGPLYIRIYRDGAQLLDGGSPVEVVTPYTADDLPGIRFVQSADVMTLVHPSHAPRELRRNSDTDWELTVFNFQNGPFQDINTDPAIFVWASVATGHVTLKSSEDLFTTDHVGSLFYMEARNLAEIPPWEGNKQIAYDGTNPYGVLRRNADGNVYRCVTNQAAGTGEEIRTGNIEPTHTKGVASDGDGNQIRAGATLYTARAGVEWEYLHASFGIVAISSYVSATEVTGVVLQRLPDSVVSSSSLASRGSFVGDGSTTVFSLAGATSDDSTDYSVVATLTRPPKDPLDDGAIFTRVFDSDEYSVNSATQEITFDVAPEAGDGLISVKEFVGANTTDIWAFGAWSESEGYPSVVTYFGDRLTFANTPSQPQTTWMSKTSNYPDFGKSVPLVDDDAITFTVNARQINEIRELLPLSDLVVLTAGGEWRMLTSEGLVAPSTISLRPQSYRGVADLPAVIIGNTALYVQAQGAAIRDLFYTFAEDGYNGNDLTLLADHLFAGYSIEAIDFHQVPYSVLWAVRDDGALLSLTYMREQDVLGWARHDTDGDAFEDVCVIPEGDEDACYVVVRRTINGATKRYIERFASRRFDAIKDAFFVDSGLTYDGSNSDAGKTFTLSGSAWTTDDLVTVTAAGHAPFTPSSVGDQVWLRSGDDSVRVEITAYTSSTVVESIPLADVPASLQAAATSDWTFAVDTLSGLDHLEGRTVSVLADGNVQEQMVVSGGSITLDHPGGTVQVGLPIEADFETLEVNIAGGETVRNKKKVIPAVSLIVRASRGIWAGTSVDKLYEYKQRNEEGYLDPVALLTGTATIPISSTWNNTGRVFVRQSDPLPLAILGVIPEVEVGG